MISVVVVSVLLVSSTIAFPFSTQDHQITGINETPQIQTGIPLTSLPQQIEKTGIQTPQIYTPTGQTTQSEQFTGLTQQQQVEKTGLQTPTGFQTSQEKSGYTQQNTGVSDAPVNEGQSFYPQNPVLLPVQPLSVVPVNPTGQVLRPVVVPAEAIADGRVIITPIGSIQQRSFHPDVFASPVTQVPHQQVHPVQTQGAEPNQQLYYAQPVQQEVQPGSQVYSTQQPLNREHQVPTTDVVKQTGEYQAQPESTQKQATYQVPSGQVPVQVESTPQQQVYSAQEVPQQQQTQVYSGTPIVVEKQVPHQQPAEYQTQGQQQQVYNPQNAVERAQEQTTSVQTGYVGENTEKQGQYQQGYTQTQQQTVEKVAPVQPVDYVPVQPTHQQQVYSAHPEQVPQHQVTQQQNVESVPQQTVKTSEVEPNQQVVQPQQVVSYAGEPVYNFGDKLPQVQQHQVPVQTLSSVPYTQESSPNSSVSSTQE